MRFFAVVTLGLLFVACADSTTTDETLNPETVALATAVEEAGGADPTTVPTDAPIAEPTPETRPDPTQGPAPGIDTDRWPTVVQVVPTAMDDTSWRFDVTISSPYDTPERYADAWRVLDADDNELGIRVLAHDHASEQPFTRSETIDVPTDLDIVFVEGRDQANGWSGERFEVTLERS